MKNRIIIYSFILTCFLFQCSEAQQTTFSRLSTDGLEYLTLNEDSTYQYTFYRTPGIGRHDTLSHTGFWNLNNDTIILNSLKYPNNYSLIEIKEFVKYNSDSIFITIKNESISNDIQQAYVIEINRENEYFIKTKDTLRLAQIPIHSILIRDYFSDYPIIYLTNQFTGNFEIIIKEINDEDDILPQYSYFINEKYLMQDDTTLIRMINHIVMESYTFIKKK